MPDGVIGTMEAAGSDVIGAVETVAKDVVTEAKTLIGDVKADALKTIAALGAVHNSLGTFTLSDEIVAARGFVEQAIVSVATHFAKTLG